MSAWSSVGDWIGKRLSAVLAAVAAVATAVGAILVLRKTGIGVPGRRGTVDKPAKWMPVPGKQAVVVRDEDNDSWVEVDLPEGVSKRDIRGAGYSADGKEVRVEVVHDRVDRRGAEPRSDSAADRLGR